MAQAPSHNFLATPLNELLGTQANVRLLRLLANEVAEAISAPVAAEYSGLTQAGARRALNRMVKTGFVEKIGSGRAQQFRLRRADPLMARLVTLFEAEQSRYQLLLSQLKQQFSEFPEIRAAWIDDFPDEVGQPLHIGVSADSKSLSYLNDELRRRILDIEHSFELLIEIHAFSPADLPAVDWSTTSLLVGGPVTTNRRAGGHQSHGQLDARAALVSRVIAEMLDRDPSLIRRAQRHTDHLLQQGQGTASHDIREWRDILSTYSRERLRNFLVADTPRAQRLRQSSPFFAALTPREREKLLDAVAQHDA